jgi:hypothetical protein
MVEEYEDVERSNGPEAARRWARARGEIPMNVEELEEADQAGISPAEWLRRQGRDEDANYVAGIPGGDVHLDTMFAGVDERLQERRDRETLADPRMQTVLGQIAYSADLNHFGDKASRLSGEAREKYLKRTAKHILTLRAKRLVHEGTSGRKPDWKDPGWTELLGVVEKDLREAADRAEARRGEAAVRRE